MLGDDTFDQVNPSGVTWGILNIIVFILLSRLVNGLEKWLEIISAVSKKRNPTAY